MKRKVCILLTAVLLVSQAACSGGMRTGKNTGKTYSVGPGKQFENISQVPWTALEAGDTVLIYWKKDGYKEKFWIGAQGIADAPVTVKGVPGPDGQLPIIDGDGAADNSGLDYSNGQRALIKIGGVHIDRKSVV